MDKIDNGVVDDFSRILDDEESTENDVQSFIEKNNRLIHLPFLYHHGLHLNCLISKFKLGNEYITDFAYLTKNSDKWKLVFVELEDPKKKIFTKSHDIKFSSEFNHAYDQITSWKMYADKNKDKILDSVRKIRVPLSDNDTSFAYVLIIGRSYEKVNNEKKRSMFSQKSTSDTYAMTYDSLISSYTSDCPQYERIILSPRGDCGFGIKYLPQKTVSPIFS